MKNTKEVHLLNKKLAEVDLTNDIEEIHKTEARTVQLNIIEGTHAKEATVDTDIHRTDDLT